MTNILDIQNDLIRERLKKLDSLRALGVDPYGQRFECSGSILNIVKDLEKLEGKTVKVAGRLMAIPLQGKSAF